MPIEKPISAELQCFFRIYLFIYICFSYSSITSYDHGAFYNNKQSNYAMFLFVPPKCMFISRLKKKAIMATGYYFVSAWPFTLHPPLQCRHIILA